MNGKALKTSLFAGILGVSVLSGLCRADLSTKSWYMDQSGTFADGVRYGQVTIDADSDAGTVKFTVTPLDVQPLYGELTNFGIDQFGFNYSQAVTSTISLINRPSGWKQKNNQNLSDFGRFLLLEKGTGNSRQTPLIFTLRLSDHSEAVASNFAVPSTGWANEGNALFAAHVAGFNADGGIGSHWIGATHAPAPTAMMLGMTGLGLVSWVRRRFA